MAQENAEGFPFDDSGCLLADKDLFENGLEEEEEAGLLQDGESLESIKAAAREKMKQQKVGLRKLARETRLATNMIIRWGTSLKKNGYFVWCSEV